MKNKFAIVTFLLLGSFVFSQKLMTKTGKVHFEANVPLFEDVDALNSKVVAVLNVASGDIAAIAESKGFKFKVPLMEEHYHENYAESGKYPKTTFTGKIANFNLANVTSTPKNYNVTGVHNYHGVDKPINSVAKIYSKDGKIYIAGNFVAKPGDYKVTIPKMVTKKIAENVNVDYSFEFSAP